jgi:endonuclease YncB( thermonuclease family)
VTVHGQDRRFYNIGLLGLVVPAKGVPVVRSKDPVKARLSELVLSNEVQVILTWVDESRRCLGVVHLGRTNVNGWLIESGLVKLNRDFIKTLPLLEQYALIRADRRANERTLAASGTN